MAYVVVLVTCGSPRQAQQIGRALVRKRLAACVNVATSPIKSIYWWRGKVETATEALMLVKTTGGRFSALEKEIRRLHSYETPEIVALPVAEGSPAYLDWLRESVATLPRGRGRGRQ